jgi:hypothetical protein
MRKTFQIYFAVLFALGCLTVYACSKNSSSTTPGQSESGSPHVKQTTQQSPPPNSPTPAILQLTCVQQNPNGSCALALYECTYGGVPLSWPSNTNFVYQIGVVGTLVGAPLPTVSPSLAWNTLVSSDGTPAPLGSFVITQWSLGSNCAGTFNSQIDTYYNSVASYFNTLANNPNTTSTPPNIDTYLQNANSQCASGVPNSSSLGFKLVLYQLGAGGAPIFACVPLNWVYVGSVS